jgi:hypothetical protein
MDKIKKYKKYFTTQEFVGYLLQYYERYRSTELVQSKLTSLIDLYGRGKMNVVDFTKKLGGAEALMRVWKQMQEELFRI